MKVISIVLFLSINNLWANMLTPDWSANAKLKKGETRENIYSLSKESFQKTINKGKIYTLVWPVSVTGMLIPYRPIKKLLDADFKNKHLTKLIKWLQNKAGGEGEEGFYKWLGLNSYPEENQRDVFKVPYPNDIRPDYYMGASIIRNEDGARGLTFSCASCHSATLFGKSIWGLNNKRVRANTLFKLTTQILPYSSDFLFKKVLGATKEEVLMLNKTKRNLLSVDAVRPQVIGLDTSLPHVALSLAKRSPDPYASYSKKYQKNPRYNKLKHFVADSKPMPWWNLKYKTRWLSDGSIISGNPALTNFLWNEIGRGTDLKKLEKWMKENPKIIKETTAAVFSAKAPHWTDFFDPSSIDLESAKRGEVVFNQSCKKCHGEYQKGWSSVDQAFLSLTEKLKTTKVIYHEKTPVKDVGTDPNRWMAMGEFSDALNNLAISKWMNTVIVPTKGYVPSPLVGIFARYPYFHNNSIPNLCELMKRPSKRTKFYIVGPSKNSDTDFDKECIGYPIGKKRPLSWAYLKEGYYDATKPGLSNSGHSRMFYTKSGEEKISSSQKKDLIEYLKTL